jgi:hypothetical protein
MMKKTHNKMAVEPDEQQKNAADETPQEQAPSNDFAEGIIYIGVLDGPKMTRGWFTNEPLLSEDRQWRVVGEAESVNVALGKMSSDFHFWFTAPKDNADAVEAHFHNAVLQLALANKK